MIQDFATFTLNARQCVLVTATGCNLQNFYSSIKWVQWSILVYARERESCRGMNEKVTFGKSETLNNWENIYLDLYLEQLKEAAICSASFVESTNIFPTWFPRPSFSLPFPPQAQFELEGCWFSKEGNLPAKVLRPWPGWRQTFCLRCRQRCFQPRLNSRTPSQDQRPHLMQIRISINIFFVLQSFPNGWLPAILTIAPPPPNLRESILLQQRVGERTWEFVLEVIAAQLSRNTEHG